MPFQVLEVIDGVNTLHVKDPKLEAHKQVWYISNVLRRGYRVKVESGAYLVEGDGLMPMMFLEIQKQLDAEGKRPEDPDDEEEAA